MPSTSSADGCHGAARRGRDIEDVVLPPAHAEPRRPQARGHRGDDLYRPVDRAILADDVRKSEGRRAFVRVRVDRDEHGSPVRDDHGRLRVTLAGGASGQGSHVLSALATADALAVIPEADDQLAAGAEVDVWWLDRA